MTRIKDYDPEKVMADGPESVIEWIGWFSSLRKLDQWLCRTYLTPRLETVASMRVDEVEQLIRDMIAIRELERKAKIVEGWAPGQCNLVINRVLGNSYRTAVWVHRHRLPEISEFIVATGKDVRWPSNSRSWGDVRTWVSSQFASLDRWKVGGVVPEVGYGDWLDAQLEASEAMMDLFRRRDSAEMPNRIRRIYALMRMGWEVHVRGAQGLMDRSVRATGHPAVDDLVTESSSGD